ncbi:MAG: beta-ketoacyl synthase N-terminal-like domain-containing protein [Chthoniobacterales bacterium]
MSLSIRGMGWVTPLGSDVSAVWDRLLAGDKPAAEEISSPLNERAYPIFRVPTDALAKAPSHPRLRRASAISRFAVVAGLAALENAGVPLDQASAARTAIIFAIANGGVVYTRRFYHDIVATGANAASPLLFPETVFNAPASHLAAILGITGASYTVVGDGAVGVLALQMAEDLLGNPALDRCLVVGAEEADWLVADAYRRWRLLRAQPPLEVFAERPRGTVLSEGAGALLVESKPSRDSVIVIEQIDPGENFRRQNEAADSLRKIYQRLRVHEADLIIASANGTFIDAAEKNAAPKCARFYAPKVSLGESVGASSLWQIIAAAQALRTQQIPANSATAAPGKNPKIERVIVSVCGLNQQAAGLALHRA